MSSYNNRIAFLYREQETTTTRPTPFDEKVATGSRSIAIVHYIVPQYEMQATITGSWKKKKVLRVESDSLFKKQATSRGRHLLENGNALSSKVHVRDCRKSNDLEYDCFIEL